MEQEIDEITMEQTEREIVNNLLWIEQLKGEKKVIKKNLNSSLSQPMRLMFQEGLEDIEQNIQYYQSKIQRWEAVKIRLISNERMDCSTVYNFVAN